MKHIPQVAGLKATTKIMEEKKEDGKFQPYYEVREKIIVLDTVGKPTASERKKEFPHNNLIASRYQAMSHCLITFTSVMMNWRDADFNYREVLNVEDFDRWIMTSGKYEFEIILIKGEAEGDRITIWNSTFMGSINALVLWEAEILAKLTVWEN